jgi:hypothetical protein
MSRSLRRALETSDAIRVNSALPLIQDTTELITPDEAREMLKRNRSNRPINWNAVERLADIMRRGQWQLHAQGLILDKDGNILTGQTRLWAVVYSGVSVYMRVSRGSPPESAFVIDRGRPQSARDLASRRTERRHSPHESSIGRCVCVARGIPKPSIDEIAEVLTEKEDVLRSLVKETRGGDKTKGALMVLGAICHLATSPSQCIPLVRDLKALVCDFEAALMPYKAESCWGKGAAFGMAMERAIAVVRRRLAAE